MNGISICMTAYHATKYIKDALDSIYNQDYFKTHDNWEVLVGVDGDEETLEYLKTIFHLYADHMRLFMMNKNSGTYITSNTIMKQAKYDWLQRFDSDDIMLPDMMSVLSDYMDNKDVVNFKRYYVTENGREFDKGYNNCFAVGQTFIRKSIWEEFGGYKPWPCSADSELIKRVSNFVRVKQIRNKLFLYRTNPNSLTHNDKTGKHTDVRAQYMSIWKSEYFDERKEAYIKCTTGAFYEVFPDKSKFDLSQKIGPVVDIANIISCDEQLPVKKEIKIDLNNPPAINDHAAYAEYLKQKIIADKEKARREYERLLDTTPKTRVVYISRFNNAPLPVVQRLPGVDYVCVTNDKSLTSSAWIIKQVNMKVTNDNSEFGNAWVQFHPDIVGEYDQYMYVENELPDDIIKLFDKSTGYDFALPMKTESYYDRPTEKVMSILIKNNFPRTKRRYSSEIMVVSRKAFDVLDNIWKSVIVNVNNKNIWLTLNILKTKLSVKNL